MDSEKTYCFWSIDLEFNNDDQRNGPYYKPEIIQVGVSVGLWPSSVILYTGAKYLRTGIPVLPRITELTGITTENLEQEGVSHQDIFDWLSGLKEEYKPFSNPVQWGGGDTDSLKEEFRFYLGDPSTLFGRRHIDVKTIFTFLEMVQGRSPKMGLRSALGRYKMQFRGEQHRADHDAENTLQLYFKMLNINKTIFTFLEMVQSTVLTVGRLKL